MGDEAVLVEKRLFFLCDFGAAFGRIRGLFRSAVGFIVLTTKRVLEVILLKGRNLS
jgi:hypothetical protein